MLFSCHNDLLVVQTPAKLNLFLQVLAKRPDGYHELESLMVTVRLYDTLTFKRDASGRIGLRVSEVRQSSPAVPAGDENLVVRAARLLASHTGIRQGVQIALKKRIPARAGLAGGSSDAAATLTALNRLWDVNLPAPELAELASRLGSDVPFFLSRSAAAIVRGRGERIEPLQVPLGLYFVIACPSTGLSTALVYQHCRPAGQPGKVEAVAAALRRSPARAARMLHNALQSPARQLNRQASRLLDRFAAIPVLAHLMTGSGTACFGVSRNRRQALTIAARLRAEQAGRVFVAQSGP